MDENIDTSAATSETTASTEPSSTTAGADLSTDTTQSTSNPTAESSTATDPAQAVTQVAESAQAENLAGVETKSPDPQPAIDWQKRFVNGQKSWKQDAEERDRFRQQAEQFQRELNELKNQYQGVRREDVEQFRASKKVQPWSKESPDHANFLDLRRTYEQYERQMRSAPDDATRQWLAQQMNQEISADEAKTLREWKADVRRQKWELENNPRDFYRDLIQREAQPVIQQHLQGVSQTYQSVQSAQNEVQKWMKDNQEVASPENIKSILGMMEKGESFQIASARIERDHYRKQVSQAKNDKQSAEEKERLLQGNAAGVIARNPQTTKKVDPKAVAQERGIKVGAGDRRYIDLLLELDAEGRL